LVFLFFSKVLRICFHHHVMVRGGGCCKSCLLNCVVKCVQTFQVNEHSRQRCVGVSGATLHNL
jgi:hypothetical protein